MGPVPRRNGVAPPPGRTNGVPGSGRNRARPLRRPPPVVAGEPVRFRARGRGSPQDLPEVVGGCLGALRRGLRRRDGGPDPGRDRLLRAAGRRTARHSRFARRVEELEPPPPAAPPARAGNRRVPPPAHAGGDGAARRPGLRRDRVCLRGQRLLPLEPLAGGLAGHPGSGPGADGAANARPAGRGGHLRDRRPMETRRPPQLPAPPPRPPTARGRSPEVPGVRRGTAGARALQMPSTGAVVLGAQCDRAGLLPRLPEQRPAGLGAEPHRLRLRQRRPRRTPAQRPGARRPAAAMELAADRPQLRNRGTSPRWRRPQTRTRRSAAGRRGQRAARRGDQDAAPGRRRGPAPLAKWRSRRCARRA